MDALYNAVSSAVRALGDGAPTSLTYRVRSEMGLHGQVLETDALASFLEGCDSNDPLLNLLGRKVHAWDVADEDWAADTPPSTPARRERIASLLELSAREAAALLRQRPIYRDGTVVITAPWERWYTPLRAGERSFYWAKYRDYLLEQKNWPVDAVTGLDIASTKVVERLADPTRAEAYQAKGLVVGYVQSGKTANFTGVIAKAIDAGYRLIIVMTGTIEMLRAQTQRRVDMEMIGKQNIVGDLAPADARDAVDYQDDEAWDRFLDLGESDIATEITRLTGHHRDYTTQFKNLKIPRPVGGKPLFDPDNLFRTDARIAVVKKNAAVLKKLVRDIKANSKAFAEIPVLIIDDESDQASVNTVDPARVREAAADGREIRQRRAINENIAAMLANMPRAQYVGYTATPFANVFVDPSDEQGIFPRDFLIGLERPAGYMGVDDFYDFDDKPGLSNSAAHVRHLEAADDDIDTQNAEIGRALDDFVLAGAVKLWRSASTPDLQFRHHTMLVHESVRRVAHAELAGRVRDQWTNAGYSRPAAVNRLRDRYERDTRPVSIERAEEGVPPAPPFDDLVPFIPKAIARITEFGGDPVIVVNSDRDVQANQQMLDFDRNDVWRVLVGGTKLSRGFTVEGLTVTYFRRATNMSDSLTQMGRWFGFRAGYRDLVRLHIARAARFGRQEVDLYEAFKGIAIDEEAFRLQLERYALWDGDRPRVTPSQIPPLVRQHLPWLKPTARNKMFNAILEREVKQPFTPTGLGEGPEVDRRNLDAWLPLLGEAQRLVTLPEADGRGTFDAFVGLVDAEAFVGTMTNIEYIHNYSEDAVAPVGTFYRELLADDKLTRVLLVLPQPASGQSLEMAVGSRAVVERHRRTGRGGLFGEVTDEKHRSVVESFVNGEPHSSLANLYGPSVGCALVYLINELEPTQRCDRVVVGYSSYVPASVLGGVSDAPRFRVRSPQLPDAAAIDLE